MCPRHYCNVCTKRTIRSCFECLESYCPMHSTGTIKYHKLMGYVCNTHNPVSSSSSLCDLTSIALNVNTNLGVSCLCRILSQMLPRRCRQFQICLQRPPKWTSCSVGGKSVVDFIYQTHEPHE